ncbi:MAG: NACHT domain-containing protein, partial [Gammaproteobacteria bacterium]
QSEIGALVEVKGRVHDLARALAIAMPAAVKVGEEGSTGSAQAISIAELKDTFADISSKELLEICFDKIFNESDAYIQEIQKQLTDLRIKLKQTDLSREDELRFYQSIELLMQNLRVYYEQKQKKEYSKDEKQNMAFAVGNNAIAKNKIINKYLNKEQTIDEKLEKYLDGLFIITTSAKTTKSFQPLVQQIYIEPECSWENEKRISLKNRCDEFINCPEQKVFVILGDPGVGKTTFGLRYIQNHWRHFQKSQQPNSEKDIYDKVIPLFIRLNQLLKDGKIIADLLENFLKEKIGLTIDQINDLKTKHILVFLDGYDEISDRGNIYQINHWKDWPHLKCIISTRPEKFGALLSRSELQDDLLRAFAPESTGRNAAIPASVVISQLLEFSSTQVNTFISQWHELTQLQSWTQERYEKSIHDIPGLSALTGNPVILSLVLFALPKIVEKYQEQESELRKKQLQRIDVYDEFVQEWFSAQAGRALDNIRQKAPRLGRKLDKLGARFNCIDSLRLYSSQLAYWTVRNQQGGEVKFRNSK